MAIVHDTIIMQGSTFSELITFLTENWDWAGGVTTTDEITSFRIDEAGNIGFNIVNQTGYQPGIQIYFKGGIYHNVSQVYFRFKIEITDTALIISYTASNYQYSASATNCEKIIICSGHNPIDDTDEQVLIYLGSKSSGNACAMYASDVISPVDLNAQNSNANVNAKTTNLIPFYNNASEYVTTDVFQSLCENTSSWYFGDVTINDEDYRMSGSVFAAD